MTIFIGHFFLTDARAPTANRRHDTGKVCTVSRGRLMLISRRGVAGMSSCCMVKDSREIVRNGAAGPSAPDGVGSSAMHPWRSLLGALKHFVGDTFFVISQMLARRIAHVGPSPTCANRAAATSQSAPIHGKRSHGIMR